MTSIEAERVGDSNVLQGSNVGNINGTEEQNDESFHSTQTIAESSATASTNISAASESNLLVPGKLYSDIVKLKQCYIDIMKTIDPYSTSSTTPEENRNIVLMINKDQMKAGVAKFKPKLDTVKKQLIDLLDCARPICLPDYQDDVNQIRRKPTCITENPEIFSLSTRVESLCSQNKADFESLQNQMESLKSTLSNFETLATNLHQSREVLPPEPIPIHPEHVFAAAHNTPPVSKYVDNFVSTAECGELSDFLNTLTSFQKEKGRSTIKFGEKYKYNGSREDSIVEFPPPIKRLLDSLNENHVLSNLPPLNSCLVTKYTGPNSFIPEHSDNERAIHAESSILTVSIGHDATVRFRDLHSGDVQEKVVKSGSLYAMTRASQDLFKHSIAKNQALTAADTRFSLTFRSLHWRNNNSTVIVGDSNTGGLKFSNFGRDAPDSHNGTFGNAMPGKRVAAFTVDQLDPLMGCGFNNVVVHCGINSIRGNDVVNEDDVRKVYVDFKTKISDMIQLNKRARFYISCLLPTKCHDINKKVKFFNSLVVDDMPLSFKYIRIINHWSRFSSVAGLLTPGLSREFNSRNEPDQLHLNDAGLRLFSVAIKNALFLRKKSQEGDAGGGAGGRVQQEGRSYSNIVSSSRGQRGGRGRGGYRGRPRQP